MVPSVPVSIAILTFKRPEGLARSIDSVKAAVLASQTSIVEVLIVDNDPAGSAQHLVESDDWPMLRYVHEPSPGVANARNRALDAASGDVLVFLDDDERAASNWPDGLIDVMRETGAALVGGPVRSTFDCPPPGAIQRSGVFDRPEPKHLASVSTLASNNLAIDLTALRAEGLRFDPAFNHTGGEDSRLSTQAVRAGLDLRWCANATVHEDVAAQRLTAEWVIARVKSTMSNYVAAQAPFGLLFTGRTLAIAGVRFLLGVSHRIVGRARRNDAQSLQGQLYKARAIGALDGCGRVLLPSRRTAAENRHYSST